MYTSILLLCLALNLADTLWTVNFGTSPSGWTAGSQWLWQDDSAYLGIMAHPFASGYDSESDSLLSPFFIIPSSADSLVVVFDHLWWGYGSSHAAAEWAQSTSTLVMRNVSESGQVFQLWELTGFCQSAMDVYYSVVDSGEVSCPVLGASPGDTVYFQYTGLVEAYVDYMSAYAYIEWDLYSFLLLSYQTQQSFVPMTWGSVKATF